MNHLGALKDIITLAGERGMQDNARFASLSLDHLKDMVKRIEEGVDFRTQERWLDWAKLAVVGSGVATLTELEAVARKHENSDPIQGLRTHNHKGQALLWCETHQHVHIAMMPRFTYSCKDCAWGQWYGDAARDHEAWTEENLRVAHTTYEVEHLMRPIQSDDATNTIRFCSECSGPFTTVPSLMEQYGGHWDTCPNRSQAVSQA